jgi:hypothetical protein
LSHENSFEILRVYNELRVAWISREIWEIKQVVEAMSPPSKAKTNAKANAEPPSSESISE